MGGHGVLRHRNRPRDIAGCEPVGFVLDQQPENSEPRRLSERGERENGLLLFHISRIIEILTRRQRVSRQGNPRK